MSNAQRTETRLADQEQLIDEELSKLACLGAWRHGLPVYYASLLTAKDETARVAAMAALLELGVLLPVHWDLAIELSIHQAVRTRAFKFFMSRYEYQLAQRALNSAVPNEDTMRTERMQAEHDLDFLSCLRLDQALFLSTGSVDHLFDAQRSADSLGGWKEALPMAVLSVLALPSDARGVYMLFRLLLAANQLERIEALCQVFRTAGVYPRETILYGAFADISRGKAKEALKALNDMPPRPGSDNLRSIIPRARALAFEAQGQYRQAYNSFAQMNEVDLVPNNAHAEVIKKTQERASWDFGETSVDANCTSHFMAVGFPRSGTTLLENALASHPEIETFEEIPAYARAAFYLDRMVKPGQPIQREHVIEARQRYYGEIERRAKKTSASIFVDKMPMNSAAIKTLENLLPGKKYIFSIRHPYDVVLSCFKQHFVRNAAMESFRKFPDACRLFDFAMTQWFDVFKLNETDRVIFVRYEDLVDDFQETTTRVLRFMGAEWNSSVLDFAARSDQRAARTPSYQKVRAGLSMGVQTSWRNYEFLFDSKEAATLRKWVEYFGYDH
jgi:tetratricopeptide (TPR) repeat protein